MIYNNFCGHKISRLGFGCMRFPKTLEETKECIDTAFAAGVNYYDTAYVYNNSEVTLAKCLEGYDRSSYYLTSKLPLDKVTKKEDVRALFEESCRRLNTDYIDFYLLHAISASRLQMVKDFDMISELKELIKEGRIKHLGFSIHADKNVLLDTLEIYDFDFVQIQLNYLDMVHEPGYEGYEILTKRGIPVVIMEPVKGGLLANIPAPLNDPFTKYNKDYSNASYCFRFLMQFPNIKIILSGMSSLEQVKDNLKTFEKESVYTKELDDAINKVKENIKKINKVDCTGCRYCMPCPFGVDIPRNFKVYNMHAMGEVLNSDWYKNIKYPEDAFADLCKKCGKCVKVCPQGIKIPEVLSQIKELENK